MTSTTELDEQDDTAAIRDELNELNELSDDVSLATSLRLHLASEHGALDALTMEPSSAAARHLDEHKEHSPAHEITDLHFRPGRILAEILPGQLVPDSSPDQNTSS